MRRAREGSSLSTAPLSRRQFGVLGLAATASLAVKGRPLAAQQPRVRVGLVGADSDGIALINQALRADPGVRVVAIADEVAPRVARALDIFTHPMRRGGPHPQVDLASSRLFVGSDAVARLCSVPGLDVVFVAGIPAYRPQQVAAAVAAGRHVFLAGPAAVDAAGCATLSRVADVAASQGLVIGTDLPGDDGGAPSPGGGVLDVAWQRTPWRRFTPGGSQEQNWYFDAGMSGGVLLTENLETIGRVNRAMGGTPTRARGVRVTGGAEWGDYAVEYLYPNGGVFRLRTRLGTALPTHASARWSEGLQAPHLIHGRTADGTESVATVLAYAPGTAPRDGSWRASFDALLAATRTAILGRNAADLQREQAWAEVA